VTCSENRLTAKAAKSAKKNKPSLRALCVLRGKIFMVMVDNAKGCVPCSGDSVEYLNFVGRRAPATVVRTQRKKSIDNTRNLN